MNGWTAEECAAFWNIQLATWRSYVGRKQAPQPIGYDDHTGRRVWDPSEVQAQRPGAKRGDTK